MKASRPTVLVIGSSNTDFVVACPRLPRPGETLLGGDFRQFHGGKGANQAVAAARAGARVVFIGAVGRDDLGRAARAALRREKIDLRRVAIRDDVSSGIALILIGGKSRENLIAVAHSANDTLSAADLLAARPTFAQARVVLSQLEVPLEAVIAAAHLARDHQLPFLLNPSPVRPLPAALFRLVDTIIPNEHEAILLTKETDPVRAGRRFLKKGCRRAIITLGARGALLVEGEGHRHFPAPKVKPVDTVGAGDCFAGWLATGIAEGLPIADAIGRALRAASLSTTRSGAQPSFPQRAEID